MDDTRNIKVCSGGKRGGMSLTKNAGRMFQTEHSTCRPWDSSGGRRALSTAGLGGSVAKEEGREEATEAREGNFCSTGVLCESKGKAGL